MLELKELRLTENDFDLLVEGLEHLPEKGSTGELMSDLLGAVLVGKDGEAAKKLQIERERRTRDKASKTRMLKEDVKILQGKLLMLKRFLMQEGALSETNDIITGKKNEQ